MILYPTETIYALGVNALDEAELRKLFALKGREEGKSVSWLVRNVEDIERYAILDSTARSLAERFLPGPLTLVLPVRPGVISSVVSTDGTVGFRVSPDEVAKQVIADFMSKYDAPLTCTSANLSGLPTMSTPEEILKQFGERASGVDTVYDDGLRSGLASTVVRVLDGKITILREGAIPVSDILS
jgi:L-threonylcarbamoyladenylate synthase